MIWFSCKKCGKAHGRAESSAGSMIFCECGQGNVVPWESTTAEPIVDLPTKSLPPPLSPGPSTPTLEPLKFEKVRIGDKPEPSYNGTKRKRNERRDPSFCFNHQTEPKSVVCQACGEAFCEACVVAFQGQDLCGPCKNFIVRGKQITPATTGWATASFFVAMLTVPFLLCMGVFNRSSPGNLFFTLSLAPLTASLCMGLWAFYQIETKPGVGGFSWALSGVATALFAGFLIVVLQQVPIGF